MVTMETTAPVLASADRAVFEDTGYHILRSALTPEETAHYRRLLVDVLRVPDTHPYAHCLGPGDIPGLAVSPDNPRGVWAGFDLPLFHDDFYDLAFHPRIALTVDALIGPDINLYETSFVSKLPGFPGDFRDWHQDSEYSDPQSSTANVTALLYLDEMDGNSGATWVVPGSHKLGPLPHVVPREAVSSKGKEVADKHRFAGQGVSFDFQPGDALIFLARLVHKSGPNYSGQLRLSLAYNYVQKENYDLGHVTRWVGAGTPIVRGGQIYVPKTALRARSLPDS